MRFLLLILAVTLVPALRAQDSVIVIDPDAPPGDSTIVRGGPPAGVVAELIATFNDSATTRMQGDVNFPPGSSFSGRLALFRGSLRLAGHVSGSVTVINATLYLLPGADVQGDIVPASFKTDDKRSAAAKFRTGHPPYADLLTCIGEGADVEHTRQCVVDYDVAVEEGRASKP